MIGNFKERKQVKTASQSRYYKNQGSPTKATTQLQADCSEYINGLKAKRQNYSTALNLYQACYENDLPQKCLKHLDFINLYCEYEHKLMCVNCLYGSTAHKNHTVTPSNKSQPQIKQDNDKSIRDLQEQIDQVRQAESRIHENKRVLEHQSQIIMRDIDTQFNQIYKMIETKHKQMRQKALQAFKIASEQNQICSKQIGWWRQQMQQMKNRLPRDGKGQQAELYKHLVLDRMLQQKLETEKLTYIASKEQMQNQFLDQVRDLKQTVRNRVENTTEQRRTASKVKLF